MGVKMQATYQGGLRCQATHTPSGNTLVTDAPVDNHGKGEAFSPTDLVSTALGCCMMTILGIVAEREGIVVEGASCEITKEMTSTAPRRIASLTVDFKLPAVDDKHKAKFEAAMHACPVGHSLHPDVEQKIRFGWGEA